MKRIIPLLGIIAIFPTAAAQTQSSIESQIIDISSEAFDAYSKISDLNFDRNFTPAECQKARDNVIAVGNKAKKFINDSKPFFDSNRSNTVLDIRFSGSKVFSAIVSTLTAANLLCSNGDKNIIDLNLELANLKFDISTLYRDKVAR